MKKGKHVYCPFLYLRCIVICNVGCIGTVLDGLVGMAIVGGIGLGLAGLAGLIGLAMAKKSA